MLVECPIDSPGFDCLAMLNESEDAAVIAGLVRKNPVKEVIEVGVWAGWSTLVLAQPGVTVHAIDHWLGSGDSDPASQAFKRFGGDRAFRTFCANMGTRLMRSVIPHRGDSKLYAAIWPYPVDLVYLDAGHSYEEVSGDIERWRRQVRKGGILAGHDYNRSFPGVQRAVDELKPDGIQSNVWWKRLK